MNETSTHTAATTNRRSAPDQQIAGWSALFIGVISIAAVGLYFVHSGPPPAVNVLTRALVTLVLAWALTVLAVALLRVFATAPRRTPPGQLAPIALLIYVAVLLVATSLEAGTALAHPDGSLDPTTDGPLAAAMALAHGPIAHIWMATFLGATAIAGRSLPVAMAPWMLRGNVVVAVVNLATIGSVYFGMDATDFYAINGWGSDALVGLVTLLWIGAFGAGLLARARSATR